MAQPLTIEPEPLDAPRPNKAHINEHLYALFAPEFVKDYPDAWIEIAFADMAWRRNAQRRRTLLRRSNWRRRPSSRKRRTRPDSMSMSALSLRQGETGPSGRSTGDNFLAIGLRMGRLRRRRRSTADQWLPSRRRTSDRRCW